MKTENIIIELRALDSEEMVVEGLLNDYTLSKELPCNNGVFREKISKEVWARALEKNKQKLFANHQDFMDFAEDLKFDVRNDGVFFRAVLKKGAEGLYQKIKDGLCSGLSFGFQCLKDVWSNVNGENIREVVDMIVTEMSILIEKTPAYNQTYCEARSIDIPNQVNWELEEEEIFLLTL